MDLRSALDVHGSDLVVHPAHGLQGGVVIAQIELTTRHVLHLKDGHAGLLVVLCKNKERDMVLHNLRCRLGPKTEVCATGLLLCRVLGLQHSRWA